LIADLAVVKYPIGKSIRAVARTTVQSGIDMSYSGPHQFFILADSKGAVMTGLTINPRYLAAGMRKSPWFKPSGFVAHIAIVIGWHMIVVFSSGGITIVTIDAAAGNALVIEGGTGKVLGIVAHTAVFIGVYVGCASPDQFVSLACRIGTVVAGSAQRSAGNVGMVEYRFGPGATADVAEFTVITICG
jgi:hypothetical protein